MPNSHENLNVEQVEILPDPMALWSPSIGNEALRLLQSLDKISSEERENVRREAVEIFSHCINPASCAEQNQNTGLVVGYVQSGKTLSFTIVSALAHDNDYRIVIIITGTSIELTNQSKNRLRKDLGLEQAGSRPPWKHYHNPNVVNGRDILGVLRDWDDPVVHHQDRETVLITVMKNHVYLEKLKELLQSIQDLGMNLSRTPILIIDDEADQAGLNNLIKKGEESTTYQRLSSLRRIIPCHTFLQYTATPQGPLMINLIDVLSPDFAAVLTPGSEYVGGRDLFISATPLIRDIPEGDIASPEHSLHEPPESLVESLRIFFLGAASAHCRREARLHGGNRSMMVHPSEKTVGHTQYHDWVRQITDTWIRVLSTGTDDSSADKLDLLAIFRLAYEELLRTVTDLEPFDRLAEQLPRTMRETKIIKINSKQTSDKVAWRDNYAWILVGGKALDRGFTVEGLTVTYMPRGVGVGNADTIQQRARFFGYKKKYLGYCRVFLESRLREAFSKYVTHEESIRERLKRHIATGEPLRELRRAFLLDRSLRPTRTSILDIDYIHFAPSDWTYSRVPHEDPKAVSENRSLVEWLYRSLSWQEDQGHPERTETQKHKISSNASLQNIYDNFLTKLQNPNLSDAQAFTGVLLALHNLLLDHPDATCTIFYMSGGMRRERGLTADGAIRELFQGAYPVAAARRGEIYSGDREVKGTDHVTIQIHTLDIRSGSTSDSVVAPNVPVVAVWLDPQTASDVMVQAQGSM